MTVLKHLMALILVGLLYPQGSFLNDLMNLDEFVNNDKINTLDVGGDPNVIVNNSSWPLTPSQRTDVKGEITLDTYDSTPTHVTNVEELETSYAKLESVLQQHADTLSVRIALVAAYNIAPGSNTSGTPVLATTGVDRGDGNCRLTFGDILKLNTAFNKSNIPLDRRVLVLCPEHEEDLFNEDRTLYNQIMSLGKYANFSLRTFNGNPMYSAAGVKQAYGATTGQPSSFAFHGQSAGRAKGTIDGRTEERWADYRGWLIGAQVRFKTLVLRNKGLGAIYSAVAPEPEPPSSQSQS